MKKTEGYMRFIELLKKVNTNESYPDEDIKDYSFKDMQCVNREGERTLIWLSLVIGITFILFFIFSLRSQAQNKNDSDRIDTIWHGKYVEGGFSYDTVSICSRYRIWVSKKSFLPGESCDYCVFIYHLEGTKKKFIRKVIIDSFSTK